jgi:autotransporter-associated beta strand protein
VSTGTFTTTRAITLSSGGPIQVTAGQTLTANGLVSGASGLLKGGEGALVLSGNNTYTGPTTVFAGTLLVNNTMGSGTGTGAVTVTSGGTLGGTGTVSGAASVASGGLLSPGSPAADPGTLATGNLALVMGATYTVQINGAGAGMFDQVNVTGTVNLGNASLSAALGAGFTPSAGQTFTIVNNDGTDAVVGTFAGLPQGATVVISGTDFTISYTGGDGNDIVLTRVSTLPVVNDPTITPATIPDGPPPANEVTITGSFTDSDTLDAHTVIIDWGDGGTSAVVLAPGDTTYGDDATPVTHRYLDNRPGNAPYTVTVSVFDGGGGAGTNTNGRVTVLNVPPVATILGAPTTGPAGTPITLVGTATDVGVLDAAAGFTFDWAVTKNGNAFATGAGAQFTFTPDGNGTYVVTLTATDKDGGVSAPVTATITATNGDPSSAFVRALYRAVLGREAGQPGLLAWVSFLQAGGTRQQVAAAFWNSAEHRGLQVDQFYATYLHRAADAPGRALWVSALLGGASEADVAVGFLASDEYSQAHADTAAYLAGLYRDVLGRAPDPDGLGNWMRAAQAGMSRAAMADAFLTSREVFLQIVDGYYAGYLGRAGGAAGIAGWADALQSGRLTPDQVALAFLTSAEFDARAVG